MKLNHAAVFLLSIALASADLLSKESLQIKPKITYVNKAKTSLTLQEAVEKAIKHRPDLQAWDYAIQANKEGSKAAAAGYYPTINITSQTSQAKGQKNIGNTTLLQADQLVYSFAGPQQKYRQAKKVTEITELEKAIQTNKIRLETEKSFLQAWFYQEQHQTIASLLKSAQTTFTMAKHQNELNLLDKNDWLGTVEQYAAQAAQVDQYQDNLQVACKRLEYLMGESLSIIEPQAKQPSIKLSWNYEKDTPLKPLAVYHDYALKYRPELKQASKKIELEHANMRLAQGARLPVITTTAQAGHMYDGTPGSSQGYHSVGLSLSWQIFDGTVNQHTEQQAVANKVKEMLNQEQTIQGINQEVQEKYSALSKAITQIKAQKMSYLRAHNEFKLRKQEFEIGNISAVDLEAAKNAWDKAQLDWASRNIETAVAQQELLYACGYPAV